MSVDIMISEQEQKKEFYEKMLKRADNILTIKDVTANSANISSDSINWSGFYFARQVLGYASTDEIKDEQVLVLGSFMGRPAVNLIPFGKGVCGTAVIERKTQLVEDIHKHPNHITCDPNSKSEIVVPVFADPKTKSHLVGVLDMDSPVVKGFSAVDQLYLEKLVDKFANACSWPHITLSAKPTSDSKQKPSSKNHCDSFSSFSSSPHAVRLTEEQIKFLWPSNPDAHLFCPMSSLR